EERWILTGQEDHSVIDRNVVPHPEEDRVEVGNVRTAGREAGQRRERRVFDRTGRVHVDEVETYVGERVVGPADPEEDREYAPGQRREGHRPWDNASERGDERRDGEHEERKDAERGSVETLRLQGPERRSRDDCRKQRLQGRTLGRTSPEAEDDGRE